MGQEDPAQSLGNGHPGRHRTPPRVGIPRADATTEPVAAALHARCLDGRINWPTFEEQIYPYSRMCLSQALALPTTHMLQLGRRTIGVCDEDEHCLPISFVIQSIYCTSELLRHPNKPGYQIFSDHYPCGRCDATICSTHSGVRCPTASVVDRSTNGAGFD